MAPGGWPHIEPLSCYACHAIQQTCSFTRSIRADGWADACDLCRRFGFNCVPRIPQFSPSPPASAASSSTSSPSSLHGEAGITLLSSVQRSAASSLFLAGALPTSRAHKMASYELSSALTISLIDVMKTGLIQSTHVPALHLTHLLTEFFAQGRRIANMQPESQVLLMTMLAMTARFTNHSAIIGEGRSISLAGKSVVRPSVRDAVGMDVYSPNAKTNSLAVLGTNRQEACYKLMQAAQKLVERVTTGPSAKPSPSVMMAMLVLGSLLSVPQDLDATRSGTRKTTALRRQYMTMLSTLSNRSDLGGRPADTSVLIELGRHNIIQDCLSTVMDGTAHRYLKSEMVRLSGLNIDRPFSDIDRETHRRFSAVITQRAGLTFPMLVGLMWTARLKILYEMVDEVTQPMRRKSPRLKISYCHTFFGQVEAIAKHDSIAKCAIDSLADSMPPEQLAGMSLTLKFIQSNIPWLLAYMDVAIQARLERSELSKAQKSFLGNEQGYVEYIVALYALSDLSKGKIFHATRELLQILREMLDQKVTTLLCPGFSIIENLHYWVRNVVHGPALTDSLEGFASEPYGYTVETKLEDLQILVRLLAFVAYSWPYAETLLEGVENEILKVQITGVVGEEHGKKYANWTEAGYV